MTTGGTQLSVRQVSVRFGGVRALDDVSLRVSQGEIVGLIGPNGAGKTTLFNCVTGLVRPDSGRVELFGQDVTSWAPHRRARLGIGRTFQRLELFGSLSVRDNLVVAFEAKAPRGGLVSDLFALPPSLETRAAAKERALMLLERVGLAEHEGAQASELPIGFSRLLELARALCAESRLLLLDEVSSGLTHEESVALARLLRELRDHEGKSMLVVEHDMSFVLELCDTIYVLDFGRLIAEGSPDDIQRDPAVQAAYLGGDEADARSSEH